MHRRICTHAMDSYDKILEITGEIQVKPSPPMPKEWTKKVLTAETDVGICGNQTKPGCDGQAGLNGMTMSVVRWLELPPSPCTMCAKLSAADAGFGNIWSLQDCIETLYEFGNEDQHSRFIPRQCR